MKTWTDPSDFPRDIDAWDEFVQRWYDTGGAVVTKRAQEIAAKIGLE